MPTLPLPMTSYRLLFKVNRSPSHFDLQFHHTYIHTQSAPQFQINILLHLAYLQ